LIFDNLDQAYLDNSLQKRGQVSNGFGEHTLQSYFGRVYYNYDEKYLLEGVLRVDGSSRFGSENRYGYFPAVSVGWVLSKESFFPKNDVVDFIKVRASWGQNGNERIGNFQYTSLMQGGLSYSFGDGQTLYNGIQPDFYPNPSIKWETSEQVDIGLDMNMFDGRVTLAFDYYDKRTKDWLISAPTLLLIGNNGPVVNGGDVKNSGLELELGFKNQFSRDLSIDIALTASTNKNEVLSIKNESGAFTGGTGSVGQNDILRAEVGKPLGYFWGYKTEGIFQHVAELEDYPYQPNAKVGDFKFADINGDGALTDADRTNIGNPYPALITGLNTGVDFKNFDMSMFWYAAIGHQIWMANRRNDLIYANYTTAVRDRWQGEDSTDEYPRVTLSDPNQSWKRPSDFYVHDANFLRLKNITLGYTLPSALSNTIGIRKLRLYVTSENLITFTKYPGMEVEVGGGPLGIGIDHGVYPQSKTFLGGMSITF
jgi:TonB-dependent starch-binding outer membrane protein SusC